MIPNPSAVILLAAVVTAAAALGARQWHAATSTRVAAFWFEKSSYVLPGEVVTRLGGDLQADDLERIAAESRRVLAGAFAGMRLAFASTSDGVWRIQVVEALRPRKRLLPSAGESFSMGFLGGGGVVSLPNVALNAVKHAPPSATRDDIVLAIGRGLGNTAVHEFGHQMLGAAFEHDERDSYSYEYWTSDRAPQYYAELQWARARPLLEARLGRATDACAPAYGVGAPGVPGPRSSNPTGGSAPSRCFTK